MRRKGYRLRMSVLARGVRVTLYAVLALFLVAGILAPDALVWRLLSLAGLVLALVGLRLVLGPAVVVTPSELILQRSWPVRRRIAWYRIHHAEVIPGYWVLLVELISGERFELPCVEDLEDLYERVEHHRKALDAP